MVRTLASLLGNLVIVLSLAATGVVTIITLAALSLGPLGYEVASIPVHSAGDIARAAVALVAATLLARLVTAIQSAATPPA